MGTLAFNNMSGIGRGGTGVLKVDGKEVATQKMEHTIPLILQWDENLDVGSDTGTPVDDKDYRSPFAFTGKLNKITLTIDRPKLTPADIKRLQDAARAAGDGPSADAGDARLPAPCTPGLGRYSASAWLNKSCCACDKLEGCRKQAQALGLGMCRDGFSTCGIA